MATFVGILATSYNKIPVRYVGAGLRTCDKYSPYPEEMNRIFIGNIADLYFAPTIANVEILSKENIIGGIYITVNTIIDVMKYNVGSNYIFKNDVLEDIDFSNERYILLTAHRRENFGEPLRNICRLMKRFVDQN